MLVLSYADDIVLLSPCIDGLQNMIDTCSRYAKKHNLSFSTHQDPQKSKTKCIAFQRKRKIEGRKLQLCGKNLPWVHSVKHLGTTITDDVGSRMAQDTLEKRAIYISRNNEINQEFYYSHPKTKIWMNNVFNTSYYGSPLWDMSSRNFSKLEKSWNASHRIMLSIPRDAHRYFIEPLSGRPHIIKSLRRRFISFLQRIQQSKKTVLRNILMEIQNDCRSTTGKNLRNLQLITGEVDLTKMNVDQNPYRDIPNEELWRMDLVKEILAIQSGELHIEDSEYTNLDDIKDFVCSS